jgi:hypothetical protein
MINPLLPGKSPNFRYYRCGLAWCKAEPPKRPSGMSYTTRGLETRGLFSHAYNG